MKHPFPRFAAGIALLAALLTGCASETPVPEDTATGPAPEALSPSEYWNSATIYFLLTDRFHNGDPSNDRANGRPQDGAVLRSYLGGDFAGLLEKIEEGWFDELGVDALWMTPFVENNLGAVDEGTGKSYGFHGYWTRDWTAVDPALGTVDDLKAVVEAAHTRGIRVLMDAVINHTGPVTRMDPEWEGWVRTGPRCEYRDYTTTVDCTLVTNLPDIRTDSDAPVELPPHLVAKWESEGRLEREVAELDAFFDRTGHPRAPRYYIVKWLTDWVREIGFDGYRVDTTKHFEEAVSAELAAEAEVAFADWKARNPDRTLSDLPFHVMGEVYNYSIEAGRDFDFGGGDVVDFFDYGYDALISFSLKARAAGPMEDYFADYSRILNGGALDGLAVLNYVSSHDDGSPYDPLREDPTGAAERLLLSPGGAQIYYGDETARPLRIDGAQGDANLRSFMNWEAVEDGSVTAVLDHWRRIARFRAAHPSVGAGTHTMLRAEPYVFSRTLESGTVSDRVLVAPEMNPGTKTVPVFDLFEEGAEVTDGYSGTAAIVTDGEVTFDTPGTLLLLSIAASPADRRP